MKVATKTMGVVEGLLVDDRPSMVLVKGNDGKITRIIKTDIGGFVPVDFEPFEYVPFHVLFCENKRMPCSGVQYVKEGEGFTRNDVEVFVGPCPCRSEDCVMGTKGELRSVSGKFLRSMIGVEGTMFGEYPKKEGQNGRPKTGSGCSATDATASKGKGKGRGTIEGKESNNGGTGGTPESTEGFGIQV
jgi:hypothetical protein